MIRNRHHSKFCSSTRRFANKIFLTLQAMVVKESSLTGEHHYSLFVVKSIDCCSRLYVLDAGWSTGKTGSGLSLQSPCTFWNFFFIGNNFCYRLYIEMTYRINFQFPKSSGPSCKVLVWLFEPTALGQLMPSIVIIIEHVIRPIFLTRCLSPG